MESVKFADGYILPIENGGSIHKLIHIAATETEAALISEKVAGEDLSILYLYDGENRVGEYRDLIQKGPVIRYTNENGTVTVEMSFREKTAVESRLDALEESQATQDGAIADIGQALSDIVEA